MDLAPTHFLMCCRKSLQLQWLFSDGWRERKSLYGRRPLDDAIDISSYSKIISYHYFLVCRPRNANESTKSHGTHVVVTDNRRRRWATYAVQCAIYFYGGGIPRAYIRPTESFTHLPRRERTVSCSLFTSIVLDTFHAHIHA